HSCTVLCGARQEMIRAGYDVSGAEMLAPLTLDCRDALRSAPHWSVTDIINAPAAAPVTVAARAWGLGRQPAAAQAPKSCQREPAPPSADRQCRSSPARGHWQARRGFAAQRRDQATSPQAAVRDLKMVRLARQRLAEWMRSPL